MSGRRRLVFLLMPLVGACAVVPTGPSRMALPGSTMSFEQFRYDDAVCRQYALEQSGAVTAGQAGQESVARSAVLGTVIGAAAGAAIGGSQGAGVGAGTGLLFGSMAGTGAAQASGYSVQQRYDQGYVQCMYAKGHRVPVSGYYSGARPAAPATMTPGPATMAPTAPAPAAPLVVTPVPGVPSSTSNSTSSLSRTSPPPPPGLAPTLTPPGPVR